MGRENERNREMASVFERVALEAIERSKANPTSLGETVAEAECPTCRGAKFVRRKPLRIEGGEAVPAEVVPCPTCTPPPKKADFLRGVAIPKTFADWKPSEAMIPAYQAVCEVIDGLRWCAFLRGDPGIGKTHLALAAADMWADREQVAVFVNVPDFLANLKETFDAERRESYSAVFDGYASAPLLVLDDLGAEYQTHWAMAEMFRVIDRRYQARAPLIVTSNVRDNRELDDRVRSRLGPGEVLITGVADRRREFER